METKFRIKQGTLRTETEKLQGSNSRLGPWDGNEKMPRICRRRARTHLSHFVIGELTTFGCIDAPTVFSRSRKGNPNFL